MVWVSQITPYYKKDKGKRSIGFQVVDSQQLLKEKNELIYVDSSLPFSLPIDFITPVKSDEVDLASFLFGYVPGKEGMAFRGRIAIEDTEIPSTNFNCGDMQYLIPDINDKAFMGGAHPSASSWWYQKANKIQLNNNNMPQFIGSGYRGRKFYFHQNPQKCVGWYFESKNWPIDPDRQLYSFPIECMDKGECTKIFRLYFEDLPKKLLELLLFTLCPGDKIRHKIGYGKCYGYGSVEFLIDSGIIRGFDSTGKNVISISDLSKNIGETLKNTNYVNNLSFAELLHWKNLNMLAKILWWDENLPIIFTYPRFNSGYQVTDEVLLKLNSIGVDKAIYSAFENIKNQEMCVRKAFLNKLPKDPNDDNYKADKKKALRCAQLLNAEFLPAINEGNLRKILNAEEIKELRTKQGFEIKSENRAKYIAEELVKNNLRVALHFDVFRELSDSYNYIENRNLKNAFLN